uniref:Uncharacterized protein n=1 Tax=Hippocampus comes TaxID=109280 RepID=A0A3Q2YRQ4_HIPCM
MEQLLDTGVPPMQWPSLSPDLSPIENLVALQLEWDAMPQQTISRLAKSMRHHCHAVIDLNGLTWKKMMSLSFLFIFCF